jgi:hypothetical protein
MKLVLSLIVAVTSFHALAANQAPSDEVFASTSVVVRQILTKNLLNHKFDDLLKAALERDGSTLINGLTKCEPASGTFHCYLAIEEGDGELDLWVDINQGDVLAAQVTDRD